MKMCAIYQAEKTNCLRCPYVWKCSIFHFFLNMYLDLLKPLLQTTATPITLIQAWFVLRPLRIFFPHVPDKCNTFLTPLISPWKIAPNSASLPTGTSSMILSEAAVFILSCFSILKPLPQGGQAFPHLLALLEVCSDSCFGWEVANTWVWSAINLSFFPLTLSILPFILLSWLAIRPKIHCSHISTLDVHLYFFSLGFWCVFLGFQFLVCCWPASLLYSSVKHHINTTYLWKLRYCMTKGDPSCLDLYSPRRQGGGIFIPRDVLFPWQCSWSISHLLVSSLALEVLMSLKTSFRFCVCPCTWDFTYTPPGRRRKTFCLTFAIIPKANCMEKICFHPVFLAFGFQRPEHSVFPTMHIR